MKKVLFIFTVFLLMHLNIKAQNMDTVKIENTLQEVVAAFKVKSFKDLKNVLFEKEHYLELVKQTSGKSNIEDSELDKAIQTLNQQIEESFQQIIKKGEAKGLIWENVTFEGYVFNSEELTIGNETKSEGYLVDSHIRLGYNGQNFTIIGIQLWLFENEYKVKGDEIRGIFEIDLDVYVPADSMYLDEMKENGH